MKDKGIIVDGEGHTYISDLVSSWVEERPNEFKRHIVDISLYFKCAGIAEEQRNSLISAYARMFADQYNRAVASGNIEGPELSVSGFEAKVRAEIEKQGEMEPGAAGTLQLFFESMYYNLKCLDPTLEREDFDKGKGVTWHRDRIEIHFDGMTGYGYAFGNEGSEESYRSDVETTKKIEGPEKFLEERVIDNKFGLYIVRIDQAETERIMLSIAKTLTKLHKGVEGDRDIRAENLLVDSQGVAYIGDLKVGGSTYFMSPEQAKGENVDERADVCSWGDIYYRFLAGTKPFEDSPSDVRELNPNVSANLAELIKRCRDRNKEKRPDFEEVVNELEGHPDRR